MSAQPEKQQKPNSVTMPDGTVVTWESWKLGPVRKDGNKSKNSILRDDTEVAEYVQVGPEEAIGTAKGVWDLDVLENGRLMATLPDNRVFTAAGVDRPRLVRAKKLDVEFGTSEEVLLEDDTPGGVRIVCESSQNYVIEDMEGHKLGQFSGAKRGVITAEIQYDTKRGKALPEDHKIFLTWVSRRVLDARQVGSTWIMTVMLLLLIAYLAYVWVM